VLLGVEEKSATQQVLSLQIIGLQVVLIIISASVVYVIDSSQSGISVLWGGFCALMNMCLLIWRMRTGAGKKAGQDIDANRHLRLMYRSALERFFVVMGLLAFGMLRLKLAPYAILLGFIVGQSVFILTHLIHGIRGKS
jgi:F0F1-type ATP synthase assembly protein I